MNQNNNDFQMAKIKIKPLRYTLMELREMNYLKRKGKPIPVELLKKPFEDFEIGNQLKTKKSSKSIKNPKIEEEIDGIKEEDAKENTSSFLSDSQKSENKSKKSSDKNAGILQLKFCGGEDDNKSSSNESDFEK